MEALQDEITCYAKKANSIYAKKDRNGPPRALGGPCTGRAISILFGINGIGLFGINGIGNK